jgi:hypothetical protein
MPAFWFRPLLQELATASLAPATENFPIPEFIQRYLYPTDDLGDTPVNFYAILKLR